MNEDEIKELLKEIYLMFSLKTIHFLDDVDNKIERYAKANLEYVISLEKKINSCKNAENWVKIRREITNRLNFLLGVVENTPKIYTHIDYYTRLVYDIKEAIKYFEHLKRKTIKIKK